MKEVLEEKRARNKFPPSFPQKVAFLSGGGIFYPRESAGRTSTSLKKTEGEKKRICAIFNIFINKRFLFSD